VNIDPPPQAVVALIAHARDVPSEARDRFADAAASLAGDPRAILLRTCHRAELYVAADDRGSCPRELLLPDLPEGGRRLEDRAAVHHLFAVAAGLDSIVVGEDQILHQLRDCLAERHQAWPDAEGTAPPPTIDDIATGHGIASAQLQPSLERLFQIALRIGRQTRAWRETPPRSLADVALDRIEAEIGSLAGQPLLVVGAGTMSRLAALSARRRRARVVVTNRTHERAAALAVEVDGSSVPFAKMGTADPAGVIVAVSGRWPLDGESAQRLADSRPPVIDLSSPPALAPELREILGARLVSVDDLASGPEQQIRDRVRRRIERLIDDGDTEFSRWIGARRSVSAIQALTERAEARRAAEVDRLMRRMPHVEDRDRELIEQMSHRLVAGLLHAPLATLREDLTGESGRAARELFSL